MFRGSALVVANPLARAIGSFFMAFPAEFPAKLVETIEDGVAWFDGLRAGGGA